MVCDGVDLRHKAIEVLLAVSAGAYQTTLLTYMIQRDLFPSIMKVRSGKIETRTPGISRKLLILCLLSHSSLSKARSNLTKTWSLLLYWGYLPTTTSSNSKIHTSYG